MVNIFKLLKHEDKQNMIRQVYFQVFGGFKLKDEVYNRRWSFEGDEKRSEGTELTTRNMQKRSTFTNNCTFASSPLCGH